MKTSSATKSIEIINDTWNWLYIAQYMNNMTLSIQNDKSEVTEVWFFDVHGEISWSSNNILGDNYDDSCFADVTVRDWRGRF